MEAPSTTTASRPNRKRLLIGGASGLALLALVPSQPVGAEGPGPAASGSAHLTVAGELTTFTFSAKQLASGEVTGQAQRQSRSLDATLHYELDCLRIIGSNKAIIGGTLTHSNDDRFAAGRKVLFNVVDNGEGRKDLDDQLSAVILFTAVNDPRNCNNFEVPNVSGAA